MILSSCQSPIIRIAHAVALRLFDVCCPFSVTAHRIDTQPEDLTVSLREFRLQAGHVTKFSGAHRSKVLGVRKQNGPAIADPFVEVDCALGGLGGKSAFGH